MAKAKKPAQAKVSIPSNIWQEAPRNGIYKLYPNQEVEIEGIGTIKNNGKEVVRLVSGKEIPKGVEIK